MLKRVLAAPMRLSTHLRFFRRTKVLRWREAAAVIILATLTVAAEAAGMAMLVPILRFVEHGRDVQSFASGSGLTAVVAGTYRWLGIPISLLSLSITAFLFVLIRQAINYFNSIQIERVKWNIGRRLSVRVFQALLGSQAANLRTYKPGEFTVTVEYECQATAAILRTYGTMWMQLVAFAAYGAVLFWTAPVASLLAGVVIVSAMLGLRFLMRTTKRLSRIAVDYRRAYADFLNERFRAWKLIKLGNALPVEVRKADEMQAKVVSNQIHLLSVSAIIMLVFAPLMTAFLLAVLYVFVEVLALDVATIVLFVLVMVRLMPIAQSLQAQFAAQTNFSPSLERVDATLKQAASRAEAIDAGRQISAVASEIRFDRVTFIYPDRDTPALADLSVSIPAHRMTALIGPSGAGKSTLVDLMPRLIEPLSGKIFIDGTPANEISLRSLRRLIAYVPQEPFLFDASIAENIRYLRPEATAAEVVEAAQLANAASFIERLPRGYDTPAGDAGAKLSGGQKQRIVLARAFVSRAQVLILDEPTSALDYESEAAIQHAIEDMRRLRSLTIIVIAHRLSTIRNADLVVQLREGKLVRVGPAPEILGHIDERERRDLVHEAPVAAQ